MAAKERLAEVVAQHAPVLYMHPRDLFMPCTVEWFMHHSELRMQRKEGRSKSWQTLIPRGEVNAELLAAAQAKHAAEGPLQLNLDDNGRPGFPQELIDDVSLYVNVKEVCREDGSVEALELNYMTFYAHNGSYWVAGMRLGAHDGDWEHLTVRADVETGALIGIYFHAHRNHDGCWVAAPDVQRTAEGRPIAYVALHGHGTYPVSGKILRALFLVNDKCSSEGLVWRPRRCVLMPHIPHLTTEELRGGGCGRPLMRVYSKGCTVPGYGSPPAWANRQPRRTTDSPESQLEIGAGGTDVYIMSGVNTPAATQQPVSQAAVSGEPCAPAREPKALPVVVPPSDPAPAAVTNGGAHVGRSKTAGDGVVDITAALAGAHIRETQAVNPGGSRAVTAVGIPSEQSGSAVVIPPAGTGISTDEEGPKPVREVAGRRRRAGSMSEALSEALSDVISDADGGGQDASGMADGAAAASAEDATADAPLGQAWSPADIPAPLVEVVESDAPWLAYLGQWGTTPSPATQRWFLNAEPAVSRTVLQRVLHFVPERRAPTPKLVQQH